MVTTRYSDQQGSKSRQKVMLLDWLGLLSPTHDQRSQQQIGPISSNRFDQQFQVSQGYTSYKNKENWNTEVHGGGGLELVKPACESASSRPKPCASLKKPHESCPFAAPCARAQGFSPPLARQRSNCPPPSPNLVRTLPASSHKSRPKTFSFRGPCAGVQIPRAERHWSWRSARRVVIGRWITFTLFNSTTTSPPSHRLMLGKVAVSRRTQYADAGIEPTRPIQPFLVRSPPVGHF